MASATPHTLQSLYFAALLALVIALVLGPRLRRQQPAAALPVGVADGLVVLALALIAGLSYFFMASEAPAPAPAAPSMITTTQLMGGALMQVQLCVCLWFYLRLLRNIKPVSFFGFRERSWKQTLAWGLGGIVITLIVMQTLTYGLHEWVLGIPVPEESDQAIVQAFKRSHDLQFRAVLTLSAGLIAPMTEELMYRGFIYGVTKQFAGHWVAMILSALIFSLAHQNAIAAFPLFILALGFTTAYRRSGSLAVPMVMHAIFNLMNLLSMAMNA